MVSTFPISYGIGLRYRGCGREGGLGGGRWDCQCSSVTKGGALGTAAEVVIFVEGSHSFAPLLCLRGVDRRYVKYMCVFMREHCLLLSSFEVGMREGWWRCTRI